MAIGLDTYRPLITGVTHAVSSGDWLSAAAGLLILEEGGNAVDAGVASGIAINVTLTNATNFGGVAPIIIYLAASDSVVTVSGLGRWPRAASIEYFEKNAGGVIPDDILRTVVPSAADAWLTALERFGTMSFEQVVAPAMELAERGLVLTPTVGRDVARVKERADGDLPMWDLTREVFMPNGRLLEAGELLVQKALGRTFRRLIDIEKAHSYMGREAAIRAARDYIYKGDIAEEIARFSQENGGLLTLEDLREFSVKVEEPEVGRFREYEVYTCGPWCQGPVVAQTLQMLEDDDLKAIGHNSPDYLHLLSQALNLSFSDRHHYYGDPDFVDVPMKGLLSKDYTRSRRNDLSMERAFSEMPQPGAPWAHQGRPDVGAVLGNPAPMFGAQEVDTSYTCVVDRWGNAFSATPSDGLNTPLITGLGFRLSSRGSQTWLDPDHPSGLQPWKRPRLTPNPAIILKKGELLMSFGTPGGDAQCPVMVQVFLNIVEFGMNPQQAIEQPRLTSGNFPGSFWPHAYLPGRLNLEGRIASETVAELSRKGHDVNVANDWALGAASAIVVDQESGVLKAGADPRRDTYAVGR